MNHLSDYFWKLALEFPQKQMLYCIHNESSLKYWEENL